jgi:hypothetical protein
MRVIDHAVGGFRDGIREITPRHHGSKTEQGIRNRVGTKFSQPSKHDRENQHGEQRLNNCPSHTEHRLHIPQFDVAQGEKKQEITIRKQFFIIEQVSATPLRDDIMSGSFQRIDAGRRGSSKDLLGLNPTAGENKSIAIKLIRIRIL